MATTNDVVSSSNSKIENFTKVLNDAKLNLYNAIKLHRNDIVVSLITEWFKVVTDSENKYFFNENYCENNTKTPLHVAFIENDYDIIRTLLNFQADPSLKDKLNDKNLTELIILSKNQTMKQILNDSLLQAIAQNNFIQVKKLIDSGVDINFNEDLIDKNSFLHWAVLFSNDAIIKLLLDNNAYVNIINKNGSTPLHDAVSKRKDLVIVELLLFYKADPLIKAFDGVYKDKSPLELSENSREIHSFIIDFINEANSEPPMSPLSNDKNYKHDNFIREEQFEAYNTFCYDKSVKNENPLNYMWPKPQIIQINNINEKFHIPLDKTFSVFVKPPNTYKYCEHISRLANVYSDIKFVFINKAINEPFITINIDKNLFNIENAYSILVKKSIIEINAYDAPGLQYALCTLLQLCKIYAISNIPELRIIDYPDTKYRGVLIDLSQGFYLRYTYLLSLLQMLTFFKLNQIHFYVKFSTQTIERKQWYQTLENWFNLVKFCVDFNLTMVPTVDIGSDIADIDDVLPLIKEYLNLFKTARFIHVGPRLSSLLICMEDKNPFSINSDQYIMMSSYLYHNNDYEITEEINKFENLIFMEYGLKVGHNFELKCKNLNNSGKPYYLCVGSSNWNSLFGCPEGCLLNLFNAIKSIPNNKPIGLLLCEFSGALMNTAFSFNLNSIFMFAGPCWNHTTELKTIRNEIGNLLSTHGLISDKDGQIGAIMLELGHCETYLTRKMVNSLGFDDLPLDNGSIFLQAILNPDDLELDNLDVVLLKKIYSQIRKHQLKLKDILVENSYNHFKEILILSELGINLLKFLIMLYNAGTKQANNTIGLNVINIGISNLADTVKTDLANKLLAIKEELEEAWKCSYYEESFLCKTKIYENLIEKLLNQTQMKSQNSLHSIYFKDTME